MYSPGRTLYEQVGAEQLDRIQQNFDEMAVHHYAFRPQSNPNFAFNVDGVDVFLVSLTCELPHRPPSPPSPSPPPPSPPPPAGLALSFGLRSLSSRLAIAVLALLFFSWLITRYWHTSAGRALRQRCCPGAVHPVVSAAESDGIGAAADEESEERCWTTLFEVSGRSVEVPLPHTLASDVLELRAALAELAGEALGAKAMPASWKDGDLKTMRVQYVDSEERPLTIREHTRFREVCASPYLRVTEDTNLRL